MIYRLFFKRILDIIFSFLALILLSPLLLLIGILIKLDTRGPVFFMQERLGKNENLFMMYKFRSMTNKERVVHRQIFNNDPEVTSVGKIIRRFKLDELPQLINVFLGEMSIIGPRPSLPNIKKRFGKYANDRFKVKPGLSSLAAVKGSIYLSWEEKGYYDVYYVNNLSFLLDTSIVLSTLKVLIVGENKLFSKNK